MSCAGPLLGWAAVCGDAVALRDVWLAMSGHDVARGWPFVAPATTQDLEPADPLWAGLQGSGSLAAAAASLPLPSAASLPHRVAVAAAGDGPPSIRRSPLEDVLAALLRDGVVVLSGCVPPRTCAAAASSSSRGSSCPAASPSACEMLASPWVMKLCEGVPIKIPKQGRQYGADRRLTL